MSPRRRNSGSAASVRARLLALAQARGLEFQLVLSEFAIERLLYRIGASAQARRFVLKGATLFRLWNDTRGRATWDLDLLGRGGSTAAEFAAMIRELCLVPGEDGLAFDVATLATEDIRAGDEYLGVRLRLEAELAAARIPLQIDIGFGDFVVPPPRLELFPTLLEHPAPRIYVYPREAVVAEKLQALVTLGVSNSRMKDFYDLHRLALNHAFDGASLVAAVRATFARRATPFTAVTPVALQHGFLSESTRALQWRAFLRRGRLDAPPEVEDLTSVLRSFLLPVLESAAGRTGACGHWAAGGPWRANSA